MNFSMEVFGINLEEIDEVFLKTFFSKERFESEILELKSFSSEGKNSEKDNRKSIIKTVCAFLNSNGGIIIWGAPKEENRIDEKTGKKFKVFSGELTPVKYDIDKDSLISSISQSIIEMPLNIKVHFFEILDGGNVYIFQVQKSESRPHQFEHKYYMRLDGQTETAPHHYIEALFKQIKYPNLVGGIKFAGLRQSNRLSGYEIDLSLLIMNHSHFQNEENVSFSLVLNNAEFLEQKIRNNSAYPLVDNLIKKNFDFDGNCILNYNNYYSILHYGKVKPFEITIFIDAGLLKSVEPDIDLLLIFMGRFSPMKSTRYKLRFDPAKSNVRNMILIEEENILTVDRDTNFTQKENFDFLLGK